ncbi:unnamed protein product [Meloidogyne enterolobii]|uniref:Uncharacterized protein n=1 Tax=Meloidogyne enterolobii TaxID=390850 RepID=A0ACB1AWC2_MELEN
MPLPLKNIFSLTSKLAKSRHGSLRFLGFKAPFISTKESPVVGLFGNFLLQTPKGFELLTQAVNARSGELVREIVDGIEERAVDPKKCTTVQLIDDLSNEICTAADLTDCVRCMHTDPKFTEAAEKSMRFFTCLVETLNTTPELYFALKRSLETESSRLDPVSLRTAKMLLEDFELSGVLLSDSERQRFVQLSNEIFDAGTKFVAGTDKPVELTEDDKKDFLKDLKLLEWPLFQHEDSKLRKFTFNKFYRHNDEQELLLKRLISSRHQIAQMTGFPTFAHRAQINSILGNYENAHKFLTSVIEGFSSQIEGEVEQIRELANFNSKNVTNFNTVGLADVEFAVKNWNIHKMQTIEEIPPLYEYFHFGKMLEGFEDIVNLLYGITFVKSIPKRGECWEGNVLKLEVYRKDEFNDKIFLGLIYIDIDQRDSKLQGDCHFTLQNGEFQTPIVVVSLGFNYAYCLDLYSDGTIGEIEMHPHQVENFFHEMGHAMHSILGRTVFQHVAGTRCSTDFAEVPSHLMECFFNDPKIFQKICRSAQTGCMLDDDLVLALIKRRKLFPAVKYTQQAIYSLFDLELHGEHAEAISQNKFTTTDLFINLHKQALPQFHIEPDYAFHHRFSHLVSYGAKYYSYLLARASSAMIYNKLFANNLIYEKANGEAWAEVQSHGGEYSSDVLLAKALGISTVPSVEQLTQSLIMEAKSPKF